MTYTVSRLGELQRRAKTARLPKDGNISEEEGFRTKYLSVEVKGTQKL